MVNPATIFSISFLKLLLIPAYFSTDFDVHRNWLAITHSLPFHKWYYEATSEWTLDYPPFFAWFEYALSHIAKYFDADMLVIRNLNYASHATILFQRLSVIFADFLFMYAVSEFCSKIILKKLKISSSQNHSYHLGILLIANAGLIIVDHIHFQYNGFLFGLQMLSITRIWEGKHIQGAVWFAILLNFKHIYLYVAPAYFLYLLRYYCFTKSNSDGSPVWRSFSIVRFLSLGVVVILIFLVSFGPFIFYGQLFQVLSRLFPFKRGLTHAYWAPNVWAMYNGADKILSMAAIKLKMINGTSKASMTGGMVQEYEHAILPSVQPIITMLLTLFSMLPSLWHLWRHPQGPIGFVRCIVLCAFGSYLFGWHVHEKAILMIIIPFCILAVLNAAEARLFILISTVGHYSLFPLLFREQETPIKVLLLLVYLVYASSSLTQLHCSSAAYRRPNLSTKLSQLYMLGLVPLFIYTEFLHSNFALRHYEFLPLMLTSLYCAIGVIFTWLKFYYITLKNKKIVKLD